MSDNSKIVRLFPFIHNVKPFIVRNHPEYHPSTKDYSDYWEEQDKRCVEGLWGLDRNEQTGEGGWRYCPPPLYYYINFNVIEQENEKTNSTVILPPLCRDVEWLFFCDWLVCRGFSGYEGDTEYTSFDLVRKLESGEALNGKEKLRLERTEFLRKADGSYKKYIDPEKYLHMTHDKPLGLPLYANEALNLMMLTPRRQGKSMWLVAILSHMFKFHGAIRYDEDYFNLKRGPTAVIGSVLGKSADTLKHFAFIEEYHKHNYGSWGEGDEFMPGWFFQQTAGTLTVSNQKSPYRNEYEERINGVVTKQGIGTKIVHVTYEDNPEASVGQGPIISIIEEVGLVTALLKILGANEPGLTRNNKFGSHLLIGTSGNMEKIYESKLVFEDPDTYKFKPCEDYWENRKGRIGRFIPGYYVDNSLRDENGNQNLEAAFAIEMEERLKLSKADNSYALDAYMMARPLVPSEMFLSGETNAFPVAMLRDQLNRVEIKKLYEVYSYKGELEWNIHKTGVIFKPDLQNKLKPILHTNLDQYKANLKGALVCYEAPEEESPNPTRTKSLYKVVYDPYRDDGQGTSLASIIVHKGISEDNWATGLQDDIVAEYLGRMDLVEDVHDLCLKIATYYNAKIMVETNIPDFIRYCKRENKYHMLQAKPYDAISKSIKNPGKKYDVGIDMTSPELQEQAVQLIRQWLLTDWKVDENGNVLKNLNKLKSPAILMQLAQYQRGKNADHVSSLKLLFLWKSQEKIYPIRKASDIAKETVDDFFRQSGKKSNVNYLNINYHNY